MGAQLRDTACIVLNYNCLPDTRACVKALEAAGASCADIIIVDNHSPDGSGEIIAHEFPGSRVIHSPENRGYAGGNNLGLLHALECGYTYALIMNPDTLLRPDALRVLHAAAEADESLGVLGCVTLLKESGRVFFAALKLHPHRGFSVTFKGEGRTLESLTEYASLIDTDYVAGSSMFLRIEALRRVGLFDERFFLYWEETELCTRIRTHEYRLAVALEAVAERGGNTFVSPLNLYYMTRNLYLYNTIVGKPARTRSIIARQVKQLLHILFTRRIRRLAYISAFFAALRDASAGRWGKRSERGRAR